MESRGIAYHQASSLILGNSIYCQYKHCLRVQRACLAIGAKASKACFEIAIRSAYSIAGSDAAFPPRAKLVDVFWKCHLTLELAKILVFLVPSILQVHQRLTSKQT